MKSLTRYLVSSVPSYGTQAVRVSVISVGRRCRLCAALTLEPMALLVPGGMWIYIRLGAMVRTRFLLELVLNQTFDGSNPLMRAAWSTTHPYVPLFIPLKRWSFRLRASRTRILGLPWT